MVSNETKIALAKAAQSIRFHSPEDWAAFLKVLASRADEIIDQCISAPGDHLHRAQGKAQEARDLLKELLEAPTLATQMYEKERRENHGRKP